RQQVENTYRKVLSGKVFVQLEGKVTPAEQHISLDEFKKLQEAHQHHHH
ncbi:MAG: trigger factor, partial [Chitinophagaceae bacterium]|nr:trigger factor [Chitinophagaceae bacterium]